MKPAGTPELGQLFHVEHSPRGTLEGWRIRNCSTWNISEGAPRWTAPPRFVPHCSTWTNGSSGVSRANCATWNIQGYALQVVCGKSYTARWSQQAPQSWANCSTWNNR